MLTMREQQNQAQFVRILEVNPATDPAILAANSIGDEVTISIDWLPPGLVKLPGVGETWMIDKRLGGEDWQLVYRYEVRDSEIEPTRFSPVGTVALFFAWGVPVSWLALNGAPRNKSDFPELWEYCSGNVTATTTTFTPSSITGHNPDGMTWAIKATRE